MSVALHVGISGLVASGRAALADIPHRAGPPGSLPDVVPPFVSELIGALADAVRDARGGVGDLVTEITIRAIDVAGLTAITDTVNAVGGFPL